MKGMHFLYRLAYQSLEYKNLVLLALRECDEDESEILPH